MRSAISKLFPFLSLLPGFFSSSCASAQDQASAYSYEMVSLPTNGPSIDNPNRPYRELWEETTSRAEREALRDSSVANAYRGGTFFGEDSDSYMVYAITPERGVFYYLPPGPYPVDGNVMLALPDTIEACRLEIDWGKLEQHPYIERMRTLKFVSKECEPFDLQSQISEDESSKQKLELRNSSHGNDSVSLITSTMRSGLFDVIGALSQAAEANGRRLIRTIPLAGINEDEMLAGLTDDGSVYLLLEDTWLGYNQRCVLAVANWSDAFEYRVRADALDSCRELRDAS